jgi:hypothetical protein
VLGDTYVAYAWYTLAVSAIPLADRYYGTRDIGGTSLITTIYTIILIIHGSIVIVQLL